MRAFDGRRDAGAAPALAHNHILTTKARPACAPAMPPRYAISARADAAGETRIG